MNVCKVPDMCKDMEYKYITEDSKTIAKKRNLIASRKRDTVHLLQITNCSKSDHHIRSRYQMQKINVIITRQGSGK